jgi:hypothetical protein
MQRSTQSENINIVRYRKLIALPKVIRLATMFSTKYCAAVGRRRTKQPQTLIASPCRRMNGPPHCASCTRHRARPRLSPLRGAVFLLFGNSRQITSSADHGAAGSEALPAKRRAALVPESASQRKMDMRSLEPITRVGRAAELPFRIEAEMDDRPVVLNLSPSAAAELREELDRYLQSHSVH